MSRSPIEMSMAAVQLTQKAPRKARELGRLLGVTETHARNYLHAMESEGLVNRSRATREKGVNGSMPYLFTWVREGM